MLVGVLRVKLVIREAHTLKDRRRVVKSLKDRLSHRFNIAIAEVGERDRPQVAELGICTVGVEKAYVNGLLSQVLNMIRSHPAADLVDEQMEFF
jgi:uncharacterized protein YlxP (DUF503 family)